jgi:hypothetical protein
MVELFTSIFATHTPIWADAQALLNIMLTSEERCPVFNKVNKEPQSLNQADPQCIPDSRDAVPMQTESYWVTIISFT